MEQLGRCDCGEVVVTIPQLPTTVNACPCRYCTRVGARWGYFAQGEVSVHGGTSSYRRASRRIEFHRCSVCGVVTHWISPEGRTPQMGVNMINFEPGLVSLLPIVMEP